MNTNRETVYVALFNLLLSSLSVKQKFVTTGRSFVPVTDLTQNQFPAMYVIQHGEQWVKMGKGIPAKRTLHCSLVCYGWSGKVNQEFPATKLNAMMDVLDTVIETPGNPANVQSLGGLVEHVYIEGEIHMTEGSIGTNQNVSVMEVPITMLLP